MVYVTVLKISSSLFSLQSAWSSWPSPDPIFAKLTRLHSALEALRNALYKFKTYLLTYLLQSVTFISEPTFLKLSLAAGSICIITCVALRAAQDRSERKVFCEISSVLVQNTHTKNSFLFTFSEHKNAFILMIHFNSVVIVNCDRGSAFNHCR